MTLAHGIDDYWTCTYAYGPCMNNIWTTLCNTLPSIVLSLNHSIPHSGVVTVLERTLTDSNHQSSSIFLELSGDNTENKHRR